MTQMSVPGACSPTVDAAYRRQSGFTLLEMLVVVLIMGLMLGLVVATSAPDDRNALALEAERLARVLDLAAEETRFAGKAIAWSGEACCYRFWRRNDAGLWLEISDNDLLRPRALPKGMRLEGLRLESGKLQAAMRLEFTASSLAPAFDISLAMGQEHYLVSASPIGEMKAVYASRKNLGAIN